MQVGKDGHASLKRDALASAGVHLDHMNTMKSAVLFQQEVPDNLSTWMLLRMCFQIAWSADLPVILDAGGHRDPNSSRAPQLCHNPDPQ
ncbi:unnamed protein product [Sphagnum balticum]